MPGRRGTWPTYSVTDAGSAARNLAYVLASLRTGEDAGSAARNLAYVPVSDARSAARNPAYVPVSNAGSAARNPAHVLGTDAGAAARNPAYVLASLRTGEDAGPAARSPACGLQRDGRRPHQYLGRVPRTGPGIRRSVRLQPDLRRAGPPYDRVTLMSWRIPVAVLLLILGAGCRRETPAAEPPADDEIRVPVAAQPARRGTLRAIIRTTGVVTPAADAEFIVTAPEPSRIVEIPPEAGAVVARGDILVRFDVPSAAAEAARHQAEIARAQALLENARVAQTRARELVERGIISRREMENADREVADAESDVGRAEAARRTSDAAAARAIIRAPFSGVVIQRFHNPGDLVSGIATDPILRLVDPDRLEVIAPVAAADVTRVLPGAEARVTSVPEPIGLVVATRPAVTASGTEAVTRLIFKTASPIPADTRVDIEIDGEEHVGTVLVPADAILRTGSQPTVLVAAGNRAERRVVTTGLADANSVEIVSGVAAGELVIIRGQAGLADGSPISVDQPRP